MGRVGDSYLKRWSKISESEEAKEIREDNEEVYMEVAGFLSDQITMGNVERQMVVNMLFGLLIHHTARLGRCPACEMFEVSDLMHKDIGCPEVH